MNKVMARVWAERAQAELGAARRFKELLKRMKKFDTHPRILELVAQAEKDEDQHAFWCAKMARKFGHKTGFENPNDVVEEFNYSWTQRPERQRLLLDVVMLCCITESMNASLLNTIYSQSGRSEAGQLIHRILKDEVKHAQIGWAYLGEECKSQDCRFVSEYLIEMATISVKEELFLPVSNSLSQEAYRYGVMPENQRIDQFKATIEEVVCAGLEHFGIDASGLKQWAMLSSNIETA